MENSVWSNLSGWSAEVPHFGTLRAATGRRVRGITIREAFDAILCEPDHETGWLTVSLLAEILLSCAIAVDGRRFAGGYLCGDGKWCAYEGPEFAVLLEHIMLSGQIEPLPGTESVLANPDRLGWLTED